MTIPKVLRVRSDPAAVLPIPKRAVTSGNTAPRVVKTMPKVRSPRQAMAKRVRRFVMWQDSLASPGRFRHYAESANRRGPADSDPLHLAARRGLLDRARVGLLARVANPVGHARTARTGRPAALRLPHPRRGARTPRAHR